MRTAGSIRPAFETIVASGPRSSLPHATTTSQNLETPVVMDWGALYQNYSSDITRTLVQGEKEEEIFGIVLEAQKKAIDAIKPGIKASYVDKVARGVIEDYGYGDCFTHSTGHGVGLEVHERPFLSSRDELKLGKNMIVTLEPGIYLKNEFGVRIEDMLLIKNRAKVLTNIPHKISP
jgi:Xaa-Pro dipeptidase